MIKTVRLQTFKLTYTFTQAARLGAATYKLYKNLFRAVLEPTNRSVTFIIDSPYPKDNCVSLHSNHPAFEYSVKFLCPLIRAIILHYIQPTIV